MIKANKNLEFIKEYKPSDRGSDQVAKLDWNECNLPINKIYSKILYNAIKNINLTEYPKIDNESLLNKLSAYCKLSKDEIQIFNGSDSALNYIFSAFLNSDSKVLIYYPHYSQIETYIKIHTNHIHYSHIKDVFKSHEYDFSAIKDNDIVYLSNPNNPTGHYLDANIIELIISKYPHTLFIIDEAYYEFCGMTSADLVKDHANIIVTRTFSKAFSLASVRLGYICCNKELLKKINKIRNTKEVNSFAQALCETSLDNLPFVKERVDLVNENMVHFKKGLDTLKVEYVDSKANYVLIRIKDVDTLIKELRNQKILVRDRSMFSGLENCVRISIGQKNEMKKILSIIKKHLRDHSHN